MAGFKLVDYSKVGKGVERREKPGNPFVLFLEIFFRKFVGLLKLGLLYSLFCIPAFIVSIYFIVPLFMQILSGSSLYDYLLKHIDLGFLVSAIVALMFVVSQTIVLGPATAGFTNVLRSYSREEHSYVWSDFKEYALSNMKQSLAVSAIDLFTLFFVGFDIFVFTRWSENISVSPIVSLLVKILLIVFLVIFFMMHIYIYPMLITFKMSIKDIYKNAALFAFMKFVPNLFIMIACVIIFVGAAIIPIYTTPFALVLFPLIIISTIGFITNFYANRQLIRYTKEDNSNKNNQNINRN